MRVGRCALVRPLTCAPLFSLRAARSYGDESPASALRHACAAKQAEIAERTAKPPLSRPRSPIKNMFFTANATTNNTEPPQNADNAFVDKLRQMQQEYNASNIPTYQQRCAHHRRNIEEKVKKERRAMLVFRDVGMSLDRPIFSRDTLLFVKYIWYGSEYAIDTALELRLRYFLEHAVNELRVLGDHKLMRGPATLSRRRNLLTDQGAARSSVTAPIAPLPRMPVVSCQHLLRYCNTQWSKRVIDVLAELFPDLATAAQAVKRPCGSQSKPAATTLLAHSAQIMNEKYIVAQRYSPSEASSQTLLQASTFRRPTMLIFTQLGHLLGTTADTAWRRLAYATVCPGLLTYMPHDETADGNHQGALAHTAQTEMCSNKKCAVPGIDIVSLRSMGRYTLRVAHQLLVKRAAQNLVSNDAYGDEVYRGLVASTTYIGTDLLRPLHDVLGVRNPLLPHVVLVDCDGCIRWMSAGLPDAAERSFFGTLLQQLINERNS